MISPCCRATCYITDGRGESVPSQSVVKRLDAIQSTYWYACRACGEACDPIEDLPDGAA
jgi:hypothetical protein